MPGHDHQPATLAELAPSGLRLPAAFWVQLRAMYRQPPRWYHTIDHIHEVALHYHEVARSGRWEQPVEVFLALLFHDVVYEYGRRDNEARSAEVARASLSAWSSGITVDLDRTAHLIRLTAHHGKLSGDRVDADAAQFLDCDLAILGADEERFERYSRGIRAEQTQVRHPLIYRFGRRRFLRRLLRSPRIYLSPHFHDRLEDAARANLRRALAHGA